MTAIYNKIIDHPSAWTSRSLGSKDKLMVPLSDAQLAAIDQLLRQTAHLAPQKVTRAEFDHPDLNPFLTELGREIMDGRGVVIVGGISPDRYNEEQFQRIYWGFGTHLGTAAVQSTLGDKLGYVQNVEGDEVQRGYRGVGELNMHTDSYEVVGLMCVRRAQTGGFSSLVSSLAIHNEILRTRPELLAPLYRGYFYASEEARFSTKPITEEEVPVYSCVNDVVSCILSSAQMEAAARLMGKPFPADLAEAIAYFYVLARREDLAVSFLLEPGEMMLWHNYTNLHSRTAFTDSPTNKRLLLRLWLNVPNGRQTDPTIRTRANTYERLYREVSEVA
jgi:hypothetical protein